jgi:hypothetical protein
LNGPPAAEGESILDESLFLPISDDHLDTIALASPGIATQMDHRDRVELDAVLDEFFWLTAWDRHLCLMPWN